MLMLLVLCMGWNFAADAPGPVHHIQVLSSDFSRDLSHSVKILPDAQGHNDAHEACAAGLLHPGMVYSG